MGIDAGLKIKMYRQERGISQKEAARRAGITASLLSQIESNKANISLRTLEKISQALGVPPARFISDPPVGEDASRMQPESEEQERRIFIKQTYNPVGRNGKRPRILFAEPAIELEMLTPRMNQKFVAYKKELSPGQWIDFSVFASAAELVVYVLRGAVKIQTVSGEYTLFAGYSLSCKEGDGLRKISAHFGSEPAVFVLVSAPPVY